MTHGGHIVIKALSELGATRVFCVAGESYLPVLDALLDYPHIDVVTCRQESGVTFMAEAHAQLSGQPGIALVTRGPGACNASIGVHTALQSSTPMILLVGLIASHDRDKEAFQEFDLKQMFGSLSKWQAVVDRADRLGEYISRAWHVALSGRPGPVVLGLPEDVLFPATADQNIPIIRSNLLSPGREEIAAIKDMLGKAERPLIIAGGGGWSDQAINDLSDFSKAAHIPVCTAFRRQDVFDHTHSNYIGELGSSPNPDLIARVKSADVILALNTRLGEMTTQAYTLFQPEQKIIHVYPQAEEFGKSYMPSLAIQSHIQPMVSALAGAFKLDGRKWAAWRDMGRADYLEWSAIDPAIERGWKGADVTKIYGFLQKHLPVDAIVTTDAGNFSGWAQRYIRYGRPGRLLAPVSGAMGYAVPAAVAASLHHPDRLCLGICGDGGFMMSAQELSTAVQKGAKPLILVCNNNVYGTIRMHQQREYPGRSVATSLLNPDFVKMGESYGIFAAQIRHEDDFASVWEKALAYDGPRLIEIVMDPAQVGTRS